MKMATWMMALQCSAAASVAAADRTLTNGLVAASVSSDCALTAIHLAGGAEQHVSGDGWALELNNATLTGAPSSKASLWISQPSASEVLCEWGAPGGQGAAGGGASVSIRYSAPARQSFVQKQLGAAISGGEQLAIGRVSPTTRLKVGARGTPHFSLDAGGVFIRQLNHSAGLMAVVQNKHTSLASSGADMSWETYPGKGYQCSASEYKGTAPDAAGTAAGCLAAAEEMAELGVDYATFHGGTCYVCSVAGDVGAKLRAMPGQTSFVGKQKGTNHTAAAAATLAYAAGLPAHPMMVPSPFLADLVVFAPYTQTPTTLWAPSGLQRTEYEVFYKTAEAFMLQKRYATPGAETVKMHVPWTANFLEEVDTSRPENLEQAKRVITRCGELGVRHILWSARDSRVVTKEQATDSWQWGASLWLTLGEKIASGEWLPSSGTAELPPSLASLLEFARSKNVSLCPYVYPSLGLGRGLNGSEEWLFGGSESCRAGCHDEKCREACPAVPPARCSHIPCSKGVSSRLANRDYQDFLIKELLAFIEKTGSMGMGFDYTFINDPEHSHYSQWAGWRRILSTVLAEGPAGLQVDNRQQNHEWGPWMWVATGSYAEPLQSDEQPESWHAFTPDLHTARLTANRMREMNFDYRMNKLCPAATAPGFFSHQSDMLNSNAARAWDSNRFYRDFDYFGYKYALLASVGSAGLNTVVNTLPARDAEEYQKFPAADLAFIKGWLSWTDANRDLLRSQRTLPIAPGHGKVDGSFAFYGPNGVPCPADQPTCPGYIFLFNPNGKQLAPQSVALGPELGIDCASMPKQAEAHLMEVFPRNRTLATVACGGVWTPAPMAGKTALVVRVEFEKAAPAAPRLVGAEGTASFNQATGALALRGVQGERGSTTRVRVVGAAGVTSVTVNDMPLSAAAFAHDASASSTHFTLSFAGARFDQSQEVVGSWSSARSSFGGSFTVPAWVFAQLQQRNSTYPVVWTEDDLSASWLSPGRLLLFLEAASSKEVGTGMPNVGLDSAIPGGGSDAPRSATVAATIDGKPVATLQSFNCRGLHRHDCFSGFYFDLTHVSPDVVHKLELTIANFKVPAGLDLGLFFDNVEAELTDELRWQ